MLNEFRSTNITWDKATRRIYSPITANASDSNGRKLNIQVVNSGQVENLTGATLHLYWETKDKVHDGLDAFTASDISKGEFEIFYTTGMLSNVGELNATLVLVDSTGKVVSDWFKITVTRGINEGAIQSEDSFSSLTQALIDISNLEQNYAPRLNDLTAQLQQKADQAFVDSQFSAIVSGAPKGTYTDLTSLQSAYPSGAEGVFLVLADGHWYYWNSTTNAWVDGGLYQSQGIADKSISENKLTDRLSELVGNYDRVLNKNNVIPVYFDDISFWSTPATGTVIRKTDGIIEGFPSVRLENKDGASNMNLFKFPALPNTNYSIRIKYIGDSNPRITAFAYNGNTHVNNKQLYVPVSDVVTEYQMDFTTGAGTTEIRLAFTLTTINTYFEFAQPMALIGSGKIEHYDLTEKINKIESTENPLLGKTAYFDGDSIMFGEGSAGGFAKMVADKNQMGYLNNARGGATVATGTTWSGGGDRRWISTAVETFDKNGDYYIIMASVNDKYNNVPLGTVITGYKDTKTEFDTTTFAGAMEYLCMTLVTEFQDKKFGYILPHRINREDYIANTNGNTYQEYRDIVKTVCRKYGVPLLDLGEVSGLVTYWPNNKTAYTKDGDGLHPNELGYKLFYVPAIEAWMRTL